jgi:hypothetical protein
MKSTYYIMRIVPKDAVAVNWDDEAECNLDGPCDLAMLAVSPSEGEVEIGRKSFASGNLASKYMCRCLRGIE